MLSLVDRIKDVNGEQVYWNKLIHMFYCYSLDHQWGLQVSVFYENNEVFICYRLTEGRTALVKCNFSVTSWVDRRRKRQVGVGWRGKDRFYEFVWQVLQKMLSAEPVVRESGKVLPCNLWLTWFTKLYYETLCAKPPLQHPLSTRPKKGYFPCIQVKNLYWFGKIPSFRVYSKDCEPILPSKHLLPSIAQMPCNQSSVLF